MATRITDYPEYAAPLHDADWMEMCRGSTGASYKVSPNKAIGLRSGQQAPNPMNSSPNTVQPGGNWGGQNTATNFVHTTVDMILFAGMLVVRTPITITQATVYVAPTAQAGSVTRFGIHSAYPDWSLKALVVDFGTIDSSTTGRKNVTGLSLLLPPGQYWTSSAASATSVALVAHAASPFSLAGPLVRDTANITSNTCHPTMFSQSVTAPAVNGFPAVASSVLSVIGSGSIPGVFQQVFFQWTES